MYIDDYFHLSTLAQGRFNIELIGVFFHVGKAHSSAKAKLPRLVACGGEAFLHGLFYVGNPGAVIDVYKRQD